jgi:hypothetical protein
MTTRFPPLRNHRVDAGSRYGPGLGQICRGGKQDDTGITQRTDRLRWRQAEMEAHNRGPFGNEHSQHRVVGDEALIDFGKMVGRRGAILAEQVAKSVDPRAFDTAVCDRRAMAEEIDVEGPPGPLTNCSDHRPRPARVGRADGDRTECAGFADRGGHGGRRDTRHRRLDDRQFDAKQLM